MHTICSDGDLGDLGRYSSRTLSSMATWTSMSRMYRPKGAPVLTTLHLSCHKKLSLDSIEIVKNYRKCVCSILFAFTVPIHLGPAVKFQTCPVTRYFTQAGPPLSTLRPWHNGCYLARQVTNARSKKIRKCTIR